MAQVLLLGVAAFPFLVMGGGLILVGLLALGPRRDISELWFCLPAGLALLGAFFGVAVWNVWLLPRRTITRFAFDDFELVIETPARGCSTHPVSDIQSIRESRGRRRVVGWWLRIEGAGSVFLLADTPNGAQLARILASAIGDRK